MQNNTDKHELVRQLM